MMTMLLFFGSWKMGEFNLPCPPGKMCICNPVLPTDDTCSAYQDGYILSRFKTYAVGFGHVVATS